MNRKPVKSTLLALFLLIFTACFSPSYILVTDPYFAQTEAENIRSLISRSVQLLIVEDTFKDVRLLIDRVQKTDKIIFSPQLTHLGNDFMELAPDKKVFLPDIDTDLDSLAVNAAELVVSAVEALDPEGGKRISLYYSPDQAFKALLARELEKELSGLNITSRAVNDQELPADHSSQILLVFAGNASAAVLERNQSTAEAQFIVSDRAGILKEGAQGLLLRLDWPEIYSALIKNRPTGRRWLLEPWP